MPVKVAESGTPLLAQVKALGRRNAHTLGFLPDGAFEDYAGRGCVLALVENGQLLGYLIYRVRHQAVVLVHLCVGEDLRSRGSARKLVDYLAAQKAGFSGIKANCRADYPADGVWPKLGFTVRSEVPGRSVRKQTTLKVWWRDLGSLDLFTSTPSDRLVAAIDMNVLIDLQEDGPNRAYGESKALLADWVREVIELVVTDEVYIEADRNPRNKERHRTQQFASGFRTLHTSDMSAVENLASDLESVLGAAISPRDHSDNGHLAKAILGDAQFFVTRDTELLANAEAVEDRWGIAVIRPCDLISRTDAELTEQTFAPRRLSGSELTARPLLDKDIPTVVPVFRALSHGESKATIVGTIRYALANPATCTAKLITDAENQAIGLLITEAKGIRLNVLLLRTASGPLADVLSRHLIWVSVREGNRLNSSIIQISDAHLPAPAKMALASLGFREVQDGYAKINAPTASSMAELADNLRSLSIDLSVHSEWIEAVSTLLERGSSLLSPSVAVEIEKSFWPAKLLDTDIASYIVPIRPAWAAQLFDERMAEQSLFGSDPTLILGLENVYYRSPRPNTPSAPSRILWYVTASNEYPRSRCVVASSVVYEVLVGPAKKLYRWFRRYGVYEWSDVKSLAKNKPDGAVMAFRFGHTEVFEHVVSLARIRALASAAGVDHLVLQSPFRIESAAFDAIYSDGVRASA